MWSVQYWVTNFVKIRNLFEDHQIWLNLFDHLPNFGYSPYLASPLRTKIPSYTGNWILPLVEGKGDLLMQSAAMPCNIPPFLLEQCPPGLPFFRDYFTIAGGNWHWKLSQSAAASCRLPCRTFIPLPLARTTLWLPAYFSTIPIECTLLRECRHTSLLELLRIVSACTCNPSINRCQRTK